MVNNKGGDQPEAPLTNFTKLSWKTCDCKLAKLSEWLNGHMSHGDTRSDGHDAVRDEAIIEALRVAATGTKKEWGKKQSLPLYQHTIHSPPTTWNMDISSCLEEMIRIYWKYKKNYQPHPAHIYKEDMNKIRLVK